MLFHQFLASICRFFELSNLKYDIVGLLFLIEVELTYSVILVSDVQRNDSTILLLWSSVIQSRKVLVVKISTCLFQGRRISQLLCHVEFYALVDYYNV